MIVSIGYGFKVLIISYVKNYEFDIIEIVFVVYLFFIIIVFLLIIYILKICKFWKVFVVNK